MVKSLVYRLAPILILALLSDVTLAGAWLQEGGRSELITEYRKNNLTSFYLDPVKKEQHKSKQFFLEHYNLYYQHGLSDDLTLGLEAKWYNYQGYQQFYPLANNKSILLKNRPTESYNFFHQYELMLDDGYKLFENDILETKIFSQTKLWSNDNSILSIQPGLGFYKKNSDKALEFKALYGYNFKLGPEYSYLNIEIGTNRSTAKFFTQAEQKNIGQLDLTLGLATTKKHIIMLQLFSKFNIDEYKEENSHIIQSSLLYKYNQYIWLQTGYSTNLNRRKHYIEESVMTSLWIKF